jgi:hypothetical protein
MVFDSGYVFVVRTTHLAFHSALHGDSLRSMSVSPFNPNVMEIHALAGNTRGGDLEAKVVASVQETVRSTDDYAPIGQHW